MATVTDLCKGLPCRTFPAGACVLEEGKRAGVLYVLASGSVEIVKGEFQITTVSEPGSFFGEVSVLLAMPHMATVRTLAESSFYVAENPLEFLQSQPVIALSLARLLAKRLQFVTSYLVDLKHQFQDTGNHLAMVDEVLDTLVHDQARETLPGSDRCPDPTVE